MTSVKTWAQTEEYKSCNLYFSQFACIIRYEYFQLHTKLKQATVSRTYVKHCANS
jgi:hypothetical protein